LDNQYSELIFAAVYFHLPVSYLKMSKTSILIADNQYLIRVGLKHLLSTQKEIELVGECRNEKELLEKLAKLLPDVVITDHTQTGNFDENTILKIKEVSPTTNILVISADKNRKSIYQVLENGITGFLTKECVDKEILDAITATAKNERFYCNRVMNHIMEKSFGKEEEKTKTPLSVREIEVVKLIVEGKIAKEIAAQLNLSTHTIYTHRKNIMKKLKLSTTPELVLYAVGNGII
jgi:DNA-binding NarL/FixJ family response regulator